MGYKLTYLRIGPVGFNSEKQEYEEVINTEWICPNCQTKNTGKFCSGCGTPRQ